MKNLLFPRIPLRQLPAMAGFALLGGLVSGVFGIVHDQLTYTLAPEYFTRFKFQQFSGADFGLPERVFVAEIGFLASWWVGVFVGWFQARLAVPAWPHGGAGNRIAAAFGITFLASITAALTGYLLGRHRRANPDFSNWSSLTDPAGVADVPAFVHAAYIHNATYIGGAVGMMVSLVCLQRWARRA